MIYKAIQLIQSQLNEYIPPVLGEGQVVIGNIAFNESQDQDQIKEKVVISLVNLEEESTLKNTTYYKKTLTGVRYIEPPVNINLYLLITSNYPQAYDKALKHLNMVVEFFQSRKYFDLKNAQPLPPDLKPSNKDDAALYLRVELFTLTFEQINHLWGSLGGKQIPFVLYKVRLVSVDAKRITGEGKLIEEIYSKENIF